MASHHAPHSESTGGFWSTANLVLAAFFGVFAFFWGAALFYGGIKEAVKLRQPAAPAADTASAAPASAPAAPAASPSTSAPAPAAAAPVAVAAAVAIEADASIPVLEITIKPDPANGLAYDTKSITAKVRQKIKITFNNTHPTLPQPHNIIIGKVGTKEKMMAIATTAITLADKGFIPESPDILAHTKLVQPSQSDTVEFVVPVAGEYPYYCTFPGHTMLMNGTIKVE